MNFKEIAKKFKTLFEEEGAGEGATGFVEATEVETGVVVTAEAFETGKEVFLKTDEGDLVQAPEGVYVLDNGLTITVVVSEEGLSVISDVKSDTEEAPADAPAEEFVSKADFEAHMSAMSDMMSKTLDQISKLAVAMKQEKKESKELKMASEEKKEAFLMGLAEKKKRIQDSKKESVEMASEPKRGFVNSIQTRLQKNLQAEGIR